MNNYNYKILFLFFVGLLMIGGDALAVEANFNAIDEMQLEFHKAIDDWYQPLSRIARWLLLTLSGLSLFWMLAQHLINGADLQGISASLIKFIMVVGFALWLIDNVQSYSTLILDGWIDAAGVANAGGVSTAGQIFELGLDVYKTIITSSDGMGAKFVNGIVGLVILIIYALITAVVFFVEVEIWVVTASGVILLGFMGNPWTDSFAQNYLRYWMASGIKLFVLFLVVGAGERFVNNWASQQTYNESSGSGELIGMSVILLVLVIKIPEMVQGLVSGSSLSSGGVGGMARKAAGIAGDAAIGTVGAAMAGSEAWKMSKGQAGSSAGASYRAANAAGNLWKSGKSVAAGKIAGGFKSTGGSFAGTMAGQIRAERTGGKGSDMAGDWSSDSSSSASGSAPSTSSGSGGAVGSPSVAVAESSNSTSVNSGGSLGPSSVGSVNTGVASGAAAASAGASAASASSSESPIASAAESVSGAVDSSSVDQPPGSTSTQTGSAGSDQPKKSHAGKHKSAGKRKPSAASFSGMMTTAVDESLSDIPPEYDEYAALGGEADLPDKGDGDIDVGDGRTPDPKNQK